MSENTNIHSQKQKNSLQLSDTPPSPGELSDENAHLLIRAQSLAHFDEQKTRHKKIGAKMFAQFLLFLLMLAFLILSFLLASQDKSIVGTVFGLVLT